MIEGIEGSSSKGRPVESVLEGSDATMKDTKLEVKMSKIEEEEYLNDQSKFKKVEMLVFWLFRVDWYFKIHKLIDS